MKVNVLLVSAVALLGAFQPRCDGRSIERSPGAPSLALLRLGQDLFIRGEVGDLGRFLGGDQTGDLEKRSDDPPISLDLTFHLLREVLHMARAEQIAHQANNNRKMMDIFGK